MQSCGVCGTLRLVRDVQKPPHGKYDPEAQA